MKPTLFAALVFLASCSGGSGAGSTPEATFEKMKAAATVSDWKTVYNCMDPDGMDLMLAQMTMSAGFITMQEKAAGPELEAILKKHGFPKDPKIEMSDDEKGRVSAKEALKGVSDKGALFADIVLLMTKYAKDKMKMQEEFSSRTLKDVKIDGDNATGQAVSADGKKTDKITFVKRSGLWYLLPK